MMHQTNMVGAILVLPYLYGIDLGRCTPLFPHGNNLFTRRCRLHHRRIHNPPPIDCCVFLRLRRPLVPRLGPRSRRPSTVDTAPTSFPTEAFSVRPPLEPKYQRPPSFRPSSSPPPSKAFSAATVHINPPPIDFCVLPNHPPLGPRHQRLTSFRPSPSLLPSKEVSATVDGGTQQSIGVLE